MSPACVRRSCPGRACARSSRPTATATGRCPWPAPRRPPGRGGWAGRGPPRGARAARAAGAEWLAVAPAAEAAALRAGGVRGTILVLGALTPEELAVALDA